jgi:hypothetical protein
MMGHDRGPLPGLCSGCGNRVALRRWPTASGWQLRYHCVCGRVSQCIAHERVRRAGVRIEDLPISDPHDRLSEGCAVCGKVGPTERHHLAPRARFSREADAWPTVDVCRDCHLRWHKVMS